MAGKKKIFVRWAIILPRLLLLLAFIITGCIAFPYIWPYPSNLKFAATSKYHSIIVTGTMLPSDDLKSVSRFKINRIIKNTSDVTLSKRQIIGLAAPINHTTCLMKEAVWAYVQVPRQYRSVGDQGILYVENKVIKTAENTEKHVFHKISFQSDNFVKRMLLQHYKQGVQHDSEQIGLIVGSFGTYPLSN